MSEASSQKPITSHFHDIDSSILNKLRFWSANIQECLRLFYSFCFLVRYVSLWRVFTVITFECHYVSSWYVFIQIAFRCPYVSSWYVSYQKKIWSPIFVILLPKILYLKKFPTQKLFLGEIFKNIWKMRPVDIFGACKSSSSATYWTRYCLCDYCHFKPIAPKPLTLSSESITGSETLKT